MSVRKTISAFFLGYLAAFLVFAVIETSVGYPDFGIVGGAEISTLVLGLLLSVAWYTKNDWARILGKKYALR